MSASSAHTTCRVPPTRTATWKAGRPAASCCSFLSDHVKRPESAERRRRATAAFASLKIDGLIVSSPPNVRYLTGFTGSAGMALVWPGGATLFTDPRYGIQAADEVDCAVRVVRGPLHVALIAAAARRHLRRLGFEEGRLSLKTYREIEGGLPLGVELEP